MADETNAALTYFKWFNDTQAGQLLSLAANSIQIFGAVEPIIAGLFQQSDTDRILSAIDQLEQTLATDFAQLGDLIRQQIQAVIQHEDALAMTTALAHSSTASDKIQRFLRTQDPIVQDDADTESDLGIQFFLGLSSGRTDPFFLPGIVKAGTVRVMVLIVEDPKFLRTPDTVNQIQNIIGLLEAMLNSVKSSVDASHTVQLKTHTAVPEGTHTRKTFDDGYYHLQAGAPAPLAYFSAGPQEDAGPDYNPGNRDFSAGVKKALAEAQKARQQGVADELAFMGIPSYEALLQHWKGLLMPAQSSTQRSPVSGGLTVAAH